MGGFEEIEVRTLGDLLDKGTPAAPDPASGRRRNYFVYRGTARGPEGLFSSLDRLGGCQPPRTKVHLEEHILRNFIRYARPLLPERLNDWELLVTAQHHGLPTRLLDWTYSPLVAAHFATLSADHERDRVVWKLDWRQVHEHFGLKPLAFLISDLDELLARRQFQSAWELFRAGTAHTPLFVCMFEPPALNARMMAQSAAFTLSSRKTENLGETLRGCGLEKCLTQFVIPAAKVEYIRDQLDMCSVDERRLFPDLDGIAAEITRYYSSSQQGTSDIPNSAWKTRE